MINLLLPLTVTFVICAGVVYIMAIIYMMQ
jgi:hypothetical protein